jgi:hypothetical protein
MSSETSDPEPAEAGEKPADSGRTRRLVKGAAIGIGSAAIVAALLYANRSARSKRPGKEP